jgi:hypothetical protein
MSSQSHLPTWHLRSVGLSLFLGLFSAHASEQAGIGVDILSSNQAFLEDCCDRWGPATGESIYKCLRKSFADVVAIHEGEFRVCGSSYIKAS